MVLYVALVAILNIGLGYALAIYLNAARQRNSVANYVAGRSSEQDFEDDDYYSDERYEDDADLEAAVAR